MKMSVVMQPIICTIFLVLWTALVQPYSKYGDYWAVIPALLTLPIAFGLHIYVAYKGGWSISSILFGIIHVPILFVIWIKCLMLISKDSL